MYRPKDMYFKIILIFSGAVSIYAQRTHELCHNYGCFDSSDTQLSVTLDGDDIYYADFKDKGLVWESRIPSIIHAPWAYQYAVHYRQGCRYDLFRWKPDPSAATPTKASETPEILVYPRDEVIEGEENTLICFINHFFPPSINIKWTKNDVELTVEDPFNKCLPNHDGTFHVFSNLNIVPKEGDIYGCTVEHASLEKPQTQFWEPDTDETNIGPDVIFGLGLFLGLLGVAAGTIFFVKGNEYIGASL